MRAWVVVVSLMLAAGCGKKGAPLAPVVRIPSAVDQIAARRVGRDVYVTLTVPRQNIDASVPADVARIDVDAYTGVRQPSRARWADLGTVVGSVPVAPVVPAPLPGAAPAPPPDPAAGAVQGTPVTVIDTLEGAAFTQGRLDPVPPVRRGGRVPVPSATTVLPLRRFYFAIPFSPRGRSGPTGAAAELSLADVPDPPTDLAVVYDPMGVRLSWSPSGGLLGFLLDREIPWEPAPFDQPVALAPPPVSGPTRYNVYLDRAPDPLELPGPAQAPAAWRVVPPQPANAAPIADLTMTDALNFERERCYVLRAVRGVAPNVSESDATPRTCVRPVDTFPPPSPTGLAAVAGEGAISLIWEPSSAPDAGGYLVLRGAAGDATLQPLTPRPIVDASYRDSAVTTGQRYVYAVVAVDDRLPIGNVSAPSVRIEETAR